MSIRPRRRASAGATCATLTSSTSPPCPTCAASPRRPAHWRIGALTTWSELIRAELPALFDGLKLAAREVGGAQIQNRGTIAGNICTASPAGDGVPNLLALDADIELASRHGRRAVPMADFIDGYRHTACRADEIVTAILVPKRSGATRSHFLKLGARKYLVISIVDGGRRDRGRRQSASRGASRHRLLLGQSRSACTRWKPHSIAQPSATAAELVAPSHLDGLAPIDDIRGSAAYRRAGGAGADARSAGGAGGPPAAEGGLMQERAPQREAVTVSFTLNGQPTTRGRGAVRVAGRHAARRAGSHRHQDRLRRGRLRRLHGAARRRAGVRLPGADGAGRGRVDRDGRRPGAAR